jgi:hypothetical protein
MGKPLAIRSALLSLFSTTSARFWGVWGAGARTTGVAVTLITTQSSKRAKTVLWKSEIILADSPFYQSKMR